VEGRRYKENGIIEKRTLLTEYVEAVSKSQISFEIPACGGIPSLF
jgi:hypothetical protein